MVCPINPRVQTSVMRVELNKKRGILILVSFCYLFLPEYEHCGYGNRYYYGNSNAEYVWHRIGWLRRCGGWCCGGLWRFDNAHSGFCKGTSIRVIACECCCHFVLTCLCWFPHVSE